MREMPSWAHWGRVGAEACSDCRTLVLGHNYDQRGMMGAKVGGGGRTRVAPVPGIAQRGRL